MRDPRMNQLFVNSNEPSEILNMTDIPEYNLEDWEFKDSKDFTKYIKYLEQTIRGSIEYREYIQYLRNAFEMNRCTIYMNVSNNLTNNIKIEIHHHPFTLYDIVNIVIRKRQYYNEPLNVQMVAKEVMSLHYKLIVGLIPLSETAHELVHKGRLFIPVDRVLGRYNAFVNYYKPFIEADQLETLDRIEKYSAEQHSKILNTNILTPNTVSYDIQNPQHQLPQYNKITNDMIDQINAIKDNNYMLPSINEAKALEDKKEKEKNVICPIYWDMSLKK